jgi:multidrug efflux pump subunit AcrB
VVDVDDSSIAAAPRKLLLIDRRKAALLGVPQAAIVSTLRAGLAGEDAAWLHDESKYPAPALLQLPAERHGELDALLQLQVRGGSGQLVPIRELVNVTDTEREQPVHHKDLLPVNFVIGDVAGRVDSPLYGMFAPAAASPPSGRRAAAHRWNISSASRATPIATTPSNGTASGRSPTKPSATWASPTPSGWS